MSESTVSMLGFVEVLAGSLVVALVLVAGGTLNWPVLLIGLTLFSVGHVMLGFALLSRRPQRDPAPEGLVRSSTSH